MTNRPQSLPSPSSTTVPRRAGTKAPAHPEHGPRSPVRARVDRANASRDEASAGELLTLVTEAQAAGDYESALRVLCGGLSRWSGCQRVLLGLADRRGQCCLAEVSDDLHVDKRGEIARAAEAALDETLTNTGASSWTIGDESPIFGRLTRLAPADALVGIPLRDSDGNPVGAVLFCGTRTWGKGLGIPQRLETAARPVAATLSLLRDTRGTWSRRWQLKLARVREQLRGRFVLASVAVLAGLLALPVPFKPKCDFTVEPVKRRYVAAPFDGTLESTFVEPGDMVQTGQVLASLDERELRWELAGLEAEYVAAKKRRDTARAKQEAAQSQLAVLEMQKIQTKIQTLRHRTENLQIQCPIDGVLVSGDLRRTEGAPVSIGQTLFEVAPLERMIAEIEVRQDDVAFVREGMPVNLRFEAFPHEDWSGKITTLHPRAELRQAQTVFIAEVELDNAKGQLRPGMNGRAKITSQQRSIGWILFRRPANALAQRVGW